jgi:pyruvate/2-oxoglutarate dehydrogenase complex dihydrolipoamide dehydrogenase (E3) component
LASSASIFARFGSQVTVIEMLPALIPQEDAGASHELAKQFRRRGITLHLGRQCTKVEDSGSELTVHFGDGVTVMADLMLVSAGRGPLVDGLGLEGIGVESGPRTGIVTDPRRRTTVPHIYAVGDCAGYWQLAHTAFREGELYLCGHCARQLWPVLSVRGWTIGPAGEQALIADLGLVPVAGGRAAQHPPRPTPASRQKEKEKK